jgi:transposase-like protein
MNTTNTNPPCIEVVTSVQMRRRWAPAEKRSIVHETYNPGRSVSYVARKYGIVRSWGWGSLFKNWKALRLSLPGTFIRMDVFFRAIRFFED